MANFRKAEYVEAYKFDGSIESVVKISKITTVNVLMRYGSVVSIEVYTTPKSDMDSGYGTVLKGQWVVFRQNPDKVEIWKSEFFTKEFETVKTEPERPYRESGYTRR